MRHKWLIAGAILLGAMVFTFSTGIQKGVEDRQCRNNANNLRLALERWSIDHGPEVQYVSDWNPGTFYVVIRDGYLKLPQNPYTKESMRELKAGEANRPGDFRFVSCNAYFHMPDGSVRTQPCAYRIVVYLQGPDLEEPIDEELGFRLGKTPAYILRNPLSRVFFADRARKNEPLSMERETWDAALKRQGY
jgi:hypothetical protein